MTDMSEFDKLFAINAWRDGIDNLKTALSKHGIGFRVAALRDANVTMTSMGPVLHPGNAFMMMDVMIASMAGYGFAPVPGSTLSGHVSTMTAARRPEEICSAHWGSAMRAIDPACGSDHQLDRNPNTIVRDRRVAAAKVVAEVATHAARLEEMGVQHRNG